MKTTLERIESIIEHKQGDGRRNHLGASVIGRECSRQLWYIFRWARRVYLKARILRLFDRGQKEEERIVKWLRMSGVHVLNADPNTGQQFRVSDHRGHFGGSLDSKLFDTVEFAMQWVLGEFKTHNKKSFHELRRKGLKESKWEHFVQTQIYMKYENLPAALYFAVNKDDDDLEVITVEYDPVIAERYIDRAGAIINSNVPPERIPNASPGWYVCRFCDFKVICHDNHSKDKNCRTCVHSRPVDEGQWLCTKFNYILDRMEQVRGCLEHEMIRET